MDQFCVPNRLKTIKKTSSGLIGKFTIKKNSKSIWELFFYKTFFFSAFLGHLETTSHFLYRGSINDKAPLQSNEAQWTKNIVFKELLMFSFGLYFDFSYFLMKFWFPFRDFF